MNVLNKKLMFFTFVAIYLIWNPKPDKDNTCTTIHFHEGDTILYPKNEGPKWK